MKQHYEEGGVPASDGLDKVRQELSERVKIHHDHMLKESQKARRNQTQVAVPVYLPDPQGFSRRVIGKASFSEDGISIMVELDEGEDAKLLEGMLSNSILDMSFSYMLPDAGREGHGTPVIKEKSE